MTAWTSDPPEREGWYWVKRWGKALEDPHYFQRRDHRGARDDGEWRFWCPWDTVTVGSSYLQTEERDWESWERPIGADRPERSVEPLTPPEPPK